MPIYDLNNHTILGNYQRIGTMNGCNSGIASMSNQNSLHVIEKQENEQTSLDCIGYIKYKSSIRESGNSSKKLYLYKTDQSKSPAEKDPLKKKHKHLMA